jgi:hypothetical protein
MRRWTGGSVALLAVLAAGCGGGDGDQQEPAERTPSGGAPAEGTAAPAQEQPPAEAEPVVETLGSIDGGRVRFILTELRRSGPTVILNARLEPADPASGDSLQVAGTFGDGSFQELEDGGREEGDVFDGVALIDPEGRKKYLVARDETNRCVCSNELGSAFVRAEAPVELTATLAAPPPGVTQVDLVVPRFGTLHDVPLAE